MRVRTFNVWSNPQAVSEILAERGFTQRVLSSWSFHCQVLDYQEYLSGKSVEETSDCDSVIVVGAHDRDRAIAKYFV
jgi:hypothetical protein